MDEAAGEWQAARGIITQVFELSGGLGLFSLPATFTRFYHTGHPTNAQRMGTALQVPYFPT
jgi:multisubunit Na+/H+ antiporter MnhG subunit